MKPLHIQTPLVRSHALSGLAGCEIWLKLEALQPPGSFKLRGIGHACQTYRLQGAERFIASSGGNAGLAVAYAGRLLQVPVTVVVPETTTQRAQDLLRQEGAELVVHGASWQEANALALSMKRPRDAFLHPFDAPLLWQGHASMVDEVHQAGYKPDAVVLSVGGGGLLCGVLEGMHRNGWQDIPVLAVETTGAASLHAAMKAGQPVELDRIATVATSLGAKRVCDTAFAWTQKHPVHSVLVSDAGALAACERFLDDHRILVEPACGASLAVVHDRMPALADFKSVLVIVCGGATSTVDQIRDWRRQLA